MEDQFTNIKVYAAWTKNDSIRFNSTSGGIFSELAYAILDEAGYICGAIYDDNNNVCHALGNTIEDVKKMRQSKYVQSDIGNALIRCKEKLDEGKIVAFVGAPCQVAALKNYLGKDYDNLYTIDFICRGVNSPKAYNSWLRELEKKKKSKITKVWFKYKKGGWKTSPRRTLIEFANGKKIVLDQENNLFMRGYLEGNLYIRKSCGNCRFKGENRCSDITLADFWGIDSEYDDDMGTSLVMINSLKGKTLFDKIINNINIHEKDFSKIFGSNPMFCGSVNISGEVTSFLQEIDDSNFTSVVRKYLNISSKKRAKEMLMSIKRKIKKYLVIGIKKIHGNENKKY